MKAIRTKADLAINGAPPAFSEPLHVGRPNIGNRGAFLQRVNQILDNQWLTNNGPIVQEFEQRIAKYLGVKHCVAMCNGTIALEIAVRALGLQGEVIVPSWTFVATAHARYWQGITPVFSELTKLYKWFESECQLFHFRDKDQNEVDMVIENAAGDTVGIEVKAAASVGAGDFSGLRKLAAACGNQFRCGIVLYDGDNLLPFGKQLFAAPLASLWAANP